MEGPSQVGHPFPFLFTMKGQSQVLHPKLIVKLHTLNQTVYTLVFTLVSGHSHSVELLGTGSIIPGGAAPQAIPTAEILAFQWCLP